MRPQERDSHLTAIEGLRGVLNSAEVKGIIADIKKALIKQALVWLEKLIRKITKTQE